ncbi:MAG: hypothetical protein R6W78_11055 [Bacteroidales bacterium]
MKKTIILLMGIICLFILIGCSTSLETGELYSLTEIRKYAKNGQVVKSKGVLTERNAKREFIVQDDETAIKIDLAKFKKESKYMKKNTKVVFSGTYRKKLFGEPKIEVESLQVVEDFR